MIGTRSSHTLILASVLVTWGCLTSALTACPFCSVQGKTLTDQVNEASMVLYGTLSNAKLDPAGDFNQGTTDLKIEAVVKKDPILGDKKVIALPRFVPTEKNNARCLVFCDVFKGKVDLLGLSLVKGGDIAKYLRGALAVKEKPVGARLRFFFDYLDNDDPEVANDAYKEFGYADPRDYRAMARKLPADKLAKWIQDPNTASYRLGLYASLLGDCGTVKHARLLRRILDDPEKRLISGIDGILAGYTLLQPQDGWRYIRRILKDSSREVTVRYAALRAARFFWASRADVLRRQQIVEGVCLLLDDPNMADLAIEDLRRWACWETAGHVLALYGKPSHKIPIVRRKVLGFALSCPTKEAAALVKQARKEDPEMVKDVEEMLKFDADAPPPTKQ
jgi:hypothetical protein